MSSIPFEFSDEWCFLTIRGLIRTEPGSIVFEYERYLFGSFKLGEVRELVLPINRLSGVKLEEGWISTSLEIRTDTLAVWDKFPTKQPGTAILQLNRRDRESARNLVQLFAAKSTPGDQELS